MNVVLSMPEAEVLRDKAAWLGSAARILGDLLEREPELARELSLEASSVEARRILDHGTVDRLSAVGHVAMPGSIHVSARDLERLTRLETVIAGADRRMGERLAEMEQHEGRAGLEGLGRLVNLAGGIVGLAKQIL